MFTLHRATINFQYSIKGNLKHRSFASITTQVYGTTASAAMQTLTSMYPNWDNFEIFEIEWKT